ncbi:hypothetical protein Tco_0965799 [Tanacetum coccineum]
MRMVNTRQGGDQPNIAAIIAEQLQNIIPQIVTQVTTNVNNAQNANGGGGGGGGNPIDPYPLLWFFNLSQLHIECLHCKCFNGRRNNVFAAWLDAEGMLCNFLSTLQPARNPLCLCGICVSIDDRDDCNTSSSTFVPYGVYNLLTISHQQNHQATNSNIEHPESRPKTVNTSTFLNQALKTADAVLPTSYEAFESLIQIEKLSAHFTDCV